nr:metallopeptidase family protein [Corynebacterium lactis]
MNANLRQMRRSIRRGRGPRGPLLPPEVPRWKSRSEAFDQAVIDAYSPLDQRWSRQLSHLDIAIDTIPRMQLSPGMYLPEEIVADGAVPLGRLISAGIDRSGNPTRPCIVVFRRPIERRAADRSELDLLLRHVLTLLVAVYLSISPYDVDPDFDEDVL